MRVPGGLVIAADVAPDAQSARRGHLALPDLPMGGVASSWLPPGVEANGYAEGTQTRPDLKESLAVGADQPTGDPEVDVYWVQRNVYPAEVPGLEPAVVAYLARMRELADELLVLCAAALGLERDFFTRHTGHATHTMSSNWYPPMAVAGRAGARPVPHRPAHRLRHRRHPGPRAGPRRTAGVDRAGRMAGRALRARCVHDQHRRPAAPLERRPVEVQPAPGAAAAGRGAGRGPRSRWSTSTRRTTTR